MPLHSNMVTLPCTLLDYLREEGYDKYKKIRLLTDEEAKTDPEKEPYKSAYKARNLLQELLEKVKGEQERTDQSDLQILHAALLYQLGTNFIGCEERPSGEELIQKSIDLLMNDSSIAFSKDAVSIIMAAQIELGILWASRYQGAEKSLSILEKVEAIYREYKHSCDVPPLSVDESLYPIEESLTDVKREAKFEKLYTHALFYLAQVHKNLLNNDLSATYCQRTLRRQLKTGEYDEKEWAVNAAGLSQYFITRNMFVQAKHCLCCANAIIDQVKVPDESDDRPTSCGDGADIAALKNSIAQCKADIARCWVKYYLALMEYSKEKLYDDVCELDEDRQAEASAQIHSDEDVIDIKDPYRMPIELGAEEEKVRHLAVTTIQQARQVFLQCKSYVDTALKFFVMDGYVTDNIELAQDMSSLYKHLIFFETEKNSKCKMHKRRADLLSGVLQEINPQFYLLICRQLQFELGEIHSDMVDLKVAIANLNSDMPSQHAVKKINSLCMSSIKYFGEFLSTLKNPQKAFPSTFDTDVERPAIIAYFYTARLYSKIIAPVKKDKISRMQQSLEHYQWIVEYVKRNPKCEPSVCKEFEICQEMVVLLPKSMERYLE